MSTLTLLNKSKHFIYWIYIYSYKEVENLPKDKILLFAHSVYTPFKNKAIPTMLLDKPLDLSLDEDLDIVLEKYKLNHVKSVSEMVLSNNTNLIAIEVDNQKPVKSFIRNITYYFFSAYHSPDYYTQRKVLETEEIKETEIYIPENKRLFLKLKISIGRCLVTTNVIMKRVFTFLYKDYFDSLLEKTPKKTKDIRIITDRDYESESEEVDLKEIDDDQLSYESYCRKHNIKDID